MALARLGGMPNGAVQLVIAVLLLVALAGLDAYGWQWSRAHPGAIHRAAVDRWRRMRTRWSRPAYLTVHFLIGLGISLASLALFSLITVGVVRKRPVTEFDQVIADTIHLHATHTGVLMAMFTSALGDPRTMMLIMLIGAILLYLRRERIVLAGWVAAFVGGSVLDVALKLIFRRDRPVWDEPFATASGFSFPSGHSMGSLVGYGMLAYLLIQRTDKPRDLLIAVAAVILVGSIGFSRIYLGVHYLSDVIAGFAAGLVWLSVCVTGIEAARGAADRRGASRSSTSDRRSAARA